MEQAIFISKINNLKYVNGDFSRLYFGIEFCQNLIPSIEDVTVILKFIFERKIELTFVTPYLTNKGMGKIKPLLNYLIDKKSETEIVVNDWGLLKWIAYEHPESNLILGRLLNKQKRGPRILNLAGRVPESMYSHFQMSNVDSSIFSNFLKNKNIKRVELDNLIQGIDRPKKSLKGSLYFPFGYVTTTRFCLSNFSIRDDIKVLRGVYECNKNCQNTMVKLKHKDMPIDLYLKGNTQFFKNDNVSKKLNHLNIDRLVFQPEIPL